MIPITARKGINDSLLNFRKRKAEIKIKESGIKNVSNSSIRARRRKWVGVATIESLSLINAKNCKPKKFRESCEILDCDKSSFGNPGKNRSLKRAPTEYEIEPIKYETKTKISDTKRSNFVRSNLNKNSAIVPNISAIARCGLRRKVRAAKTARR
jgi:hypothetical protein